MKIKAKDMKSCFNCRNADAFILKSLTPIDLEEILVECVSRTDGDRRLHIGNECPDWEKKG